VPLEEPRWWYGAGEAPAYTPLLRAASRLYGAAAMARYRRAAAVDAALPVICAGNFTAGGTGKTPLAIFIARLIAADGISPAFLTRGYGGRERGPAWVEAGPGAAWRFGDEPVLLSRVAPALVAHDRVRGARAICDSGRGIGAIVMDDGMQNGALAKDLTLAVVDAGRGLGNGEVIPMGPLRAPIDFKLGLVDANVVRGDSAAAPDGIHALLRRRFPGPVLAARTVPEGDTAWLSGAPVVAFAGIANPERFFALLESLGARIRERFSFRDHHAFTQADARRLLHAASAAKGALVTTEKDLVRLQGSADAKGELGAAARPLAIGLAFEPRDLERLSTLVKAALHKRARHDG
jgi:tetraacyldisaccharide 4'-kinase